MRQNMALGLVALLTSLLLQPGAEAQFPPVGRTDVPRDAGPTTSYRIKRRTVNGIVKSLDKEKRTLLLVPRKGKEAKEVLILVGPSEIRAGKGGATFADIQEGDRIRVYGETTVQGGVRAMEITLPAERMSIPPPPKSEKKPKKAKQAEPARAPAEAPAQAPDQPKEEGKKQ